MTEESQQHEFIPLWTGGAPRAVGTDDLDTPALTVHLPNTSNATGCGVIVAPGGGYRILSSDYEGLQVAQKLNEFGIAAFVLRYRVAPTYGSDVSLLDGQRAVRLTRQHAHRYGLHSIGFLGFSAGGHLAVNVGTAPDEFNSTAEDPIDRQSARPDFLVPVYAVTNGLVRGKKADEYTPTDTLVDAETPETFLVHTHEDGIVFAEQSIIFYEALRRNGVAAELHIFNHGEHGVGLASDDPDVSLWPELLRRWLARRSYLTDKPGVKVKGKVTINGDVPGIVWVTLEPKDVNSPCTRVMVNRGSEGAFTIPHEKGPVRGEHAVTVRHLSEKFPHDATGSYSISQEESYETRAFITDKTFLNIKLDDSHKIRSGDSKRH